MIHGFKVKHYLVVCAGKKLLSFKIFTNESVGKQTQIWFTKEYALEFVLRLQTCLG